MEKRASAEARAYRRLITALQAGEAANARFHALWDACEGDEEPEEDQERAVSDAVIEAERRIEDEIANWQRVVLGGDVDQTIRATLSMLREVEDHMREPESDPRYARRFGPVLDAIRRALEPS